MKHVPLSEVVAELESGSRPKGGVADKGGDIPSLGAEHLDDSGHFKLNKLKLVPRNFFDQMRSGHIHQEDILIVKDGATTGKTSFVDESFPCEKAAINEHVFRLAIEARKTFPKYVFRFLHSPIGLQQILKDFRGATVGGISRGFTDKVSLPFPSLAEQKRIAAILDRADAIRRKRKQAIHLADEFLRSIFLDMFGDPGINPKNWPMGTIRDLAADVRYGSSSKAGAQGEFPILRMNNITYTGSWNFGDLKYIDLSKKDQAKYLVHQGELLFNRTNSKELVGKTAVYREATSMAFAGYLIRVRTNELANPEYISAYLNSRHGKLTLESMCKSIVGMANINAQEMQDIKIAIPPRKLQDRYAGIVHRTLKHRSKHVLADNSANKLFGSLSQRAFRGDI